MPTAKHSAETPQSEASTVRPHSANAQAAPSVSKAAKKLDDAATRILVTNRVKARESQERQVTKKNDSRPRRGPNRARQSAAKFRKLIDALQVNELLERMRWEFFEIGLDALETVRIAVRSGDAKLSYRILKDLGVNRAPAPAPEPQTSGHAERDRIVGLCLTAVHERAVAYGLDPEEALRLPPIDESRVVAQHRKPPTATK